MINLKNMFKKVISIWRSFFECNYYLQVVNQDPRVVNQDLRVVNQDPRVVNQDLRVVEPRPTGGDLQGLRRTVSRRGATMKILTPTSTIIS